MADTTKKFQQLSCREAGKFDFTNKLKAKLTGWGWICKERENKPGTRKARVLANKA